MENDVIQRIRSIITENNLSVNQLAKKIDLPQKTVNNYMHGVRKISYDFIHQIISTFGLNANWLILGKGDTYLSDTPDPSQSSYSIKPYIDPNQILTNQFKSFSTIIKNTQPDSLPLPFINEYDFSIKAKGDSMVNNQNSEKSIKDGDIVVCKLWKSRTHIRWGEMYALSTTEGIIIKKLLPSELEGCIQCVSYNIEEGYMPYDLPVEEIIDWAIVIGIINVRVWH